MEINELVTSMIDALVSDETWLAWCRDNLAAMPMVAFEPDVPEEAVPDDQYPFVFLYNVRSAGSGWTIEVSIGLAMEDSAATETRSAMLYGATHSITVEVCQGLLRSGAMLRQVMDCLYRAKLGAMSADGETGTVNLAPYFEAYGTFRADPQRTTRKPLGR